MPLTSFFHPQNPQTGSMHTPYFVLRPSPPMMPYAISIRILGEIINIPHQTQSQPKPDTCNTLPINPHILNLSQPRRRPVQALETSEQQSMHGARGKNLSRSSSTTRTRSIADPALRSKITTKLRGAYQRSNQRSSGRARKRGAAALSTLCRPRGSAGLYSIPPMDACRIPRAPCVERTQSQSQESEPGGLRSHDKETANSTTVSEIPCGSNNLQRISFPIGGYLAR